MPRLGFNPTRRNRNIGTPKAGHGQKNRLVIPDAWADGRCFYENLDDPVEIPRVVRSVELRVLVEPSLPGFAHACTVDDVARLLELIPIAHFQAIKIIVFRQPKRKQRILSPVWGRLVYWSEIGDLSGPAVYLEAQDVNSVSKWKKSLNPDLARELERLRDDGHLISSDKRHFIISATLDSVRNTQLYRTLPHEIGHYVDYLQSVEIPGRDNLDKWLSLNAKYHNKPVSEKEAFAHRYADEFREKQHRRGNLPYDRVVNNAAMRRLKLKPEWFDAPNIADS
jgi:hypothetical protein